MNEFAKIQLQELHADYVKQLPGKWEAIEKQWNILSQCFDKCGLKDLYLAVHTLSGAIGNYGYVELSRNMRDFEEYLQQLLDYSEVNATHCSEISHMVAQIKEIIQKKTSAQFSEVVLSNKAIENHLLLYLVEAQGKFEHDLQKSLSEVGYELVLLKTLAELLVFTEKRLPAAIIIDGCHLDDKEISVLERLKQYHQITMLCLVKHDDLSTRIKSIQAGASVFLCKPINVSYLTNRLVQICSMSANENYRILILEDSEYLAAYYALILEEAGMTVRAITNPMNLMKEMRDFNPRLLLLDLYLSGCTGFDLAKVVRQEERYASLPIVFVSTETDRYKQLAILSGCGGDDFLTKPVLPQNLVAAIKSRAQRSALVVSYIVQDSLTQLLNHSYSLTQLELEIARAHREHQGISVAMIDLDHFKLVNDEYGHPVGDMVLKKVAGYISGVLRRTDFIGRYGGEEFIIIFSNTSMDNAVRLCNKICEKFSTEPFADNGNEFFVTLSIGIANYPTYQTADALVAAADRALYQAKLKGRNRVDY